MVKVKFKKRCGILISIALCLSAVLTFSVSSAKYATRHEYTIRLAMAEHFTFSAGTQHTFEIPYDGYYAFRLWGGDGGNSQNSWSSGEDIYQLGGEGGEVAGVSYFRKGTVLVITVGTKGGTTGGGFNGGGSGGTYLLPVFNDYFGGGGGGATDVRLSSGDIGDRILVAGGGGGGSGGSLGASGQNFQPGYGGNGGSTSGNMNGENGDGDGSGLGGTQTSGGPGWQSGSLGQGGNGNYSGGGGGGGYYGGGGAYGSGGGGGGGSSYIAGEFIIGAPEGLPDISDYVTNARDGYAIISFLGSRYTVSEIHGEGTPSRHDEVEAFPEPEEPISDSINSIPEPDPTPEPDPDSTSGFTTGPESDSGFIPDAATSGLTEYTTGGRFSSN